MVVLEPQQIESHIAFGAFAPYLHGFRANPIRKFAEGYARTNSIFVADFFFFLEIMGAICHGLRSNFWSAANILRSFFVTSVLWMELCRYFSVKEVARHGPPR